MVALKVVSYNVHGLKDDRAAMIAMIRELAPDVVVVQEAPRRFRWRTKGAMLADDFGLVVGAGGLPSLGNLLLVSLRLRVHESWCVRYPLTPGRHMRGAAFARCSVRGATFTISGSHLATDPVERPAQARLWKEELARIEGPVIAAGDLNEGPDGGSYRAVADGFRPNDSALLTFPAAKPRIRLDSVFVTPDISVESYAVVDTDQARRASDHLPVVAELELPST